MKNQVKYFDNEQEFEIASAEYILAKALSSVAEKDFFTISLTGGSTPSKIYEILTKNPYKVRFPWDKTYFFLGDERVLPSENPESNIYMINKLLFSNIKIPSKNKIFPNTNLNSSHDIAKDYESKINDFFKMKKLDFDLFLLGMGLDCHTASLFPEDYIWRNNSNLVLFTSKPIGEPKVYRVSMGLPLINQSKNILMLISGKAKKTVAEELFKNMKEGKNPTKSPIPEINNIGEFVWHIN